MGLSMGSSVENRLYKYLKNVQPTPYMEVLKYYYNDLSLNGISWSDFMLEDVGYHTLCNLFGEIATIYVDNFEVLHFVWSFKVDWIYGIIQWLEAKSRLGPILLNRNWNVQIFDQDYQCCTRCFDLLKGYIKERG